MPMLDKVRLDGLTRSFATRRIPTTAMQSLVIDERRTHAGDIVLCRVNALGSHSRIELPSGRRALLRIGDEILLACGNRYAPD